MVYFMHQLEKVGVDMESIVTDKERTDTQLATIYELRLQILKEEMNEYTQEEILKLLDTIALEKSTK